MTVRASEFPLRFVPVSWLSPAFLRLQLFADVAFSARSVVLAPQMRVVWRLCERVSAACRYHG